jgi:hypothetical protein
MYRLQIKLDLKKSSLHTKNLTILPLPQLDLRCTSCVDGCTSYIVYGLLDLLDGWLADWLVGQSIGRSLVYLLDGRLPESLVGYFDASLSN